MPQQDTSQLKEKIINILKIKGPGLPVQIAREIGISPLFTSAFLSEILSEKKIKLSHMKVGNSPLYLIPGHESQLEKFSKYLKSKEKDAFELLQQNKFLKDSKQEPAIRVALRALKDFAVPFKYNEEIYWRYFTEKEEFKPQKEFKPLPKSEAPIQKQISSKPKTDSQKIIQLQVEQDQKLIPKISSEKELDIFDKTPKEKPKIKKSQRKTTPKKTNEKFFNKIKEHLNKNSIELMDIENFSKNEIILKIKENQQEKLLYAFNKKRITDKDIIKADKKASDLNLHYIILSQGEPMKKLQNLIKAIKNLNRLERIE